jgi:hypothetical protein
VAASIDIHLPPDWRGQSLPGDLRRLEDEGYVHLRAVLSRAQIGAMHRAWDLSLARPDADRSPDANWAPSALAEDPAFAPCLSQPQVMSLVAVLLEGQVRLRDLHGRAPPLGHGRQGLHVDWTNTFWILDDMAPENGALRLVPGSHRTGHPPRGTWAQPHGSHPHEIAVRAHAGDVIVADARLWHGGSLNQSGRRRRLIIAQFSRPTDTFPPGLYRAAGT